MKRTAPKKCSWAVLIFIWAIIQSVLPKDQAKELWMPGLENTHVMEELSFELLACDWSFTGQFAFQPTIVSSWIKGVTQRMNVQPFILSHLWTHRSSLNLRSGELTFNACLESGIEETIETWVPKGHFLHFNRWPLNSWSSLTWGNGLTFRSLSLHSLAIER